MKTDHKTALVIELDEEIVEHLRSPECGAGKFHLCGYAENIAAAAWESARQDPPARGEG